MSRVRDDSPGDERALLLYRQWLHDICTESAETGDVGSRHKGVVAVARRALEEARRVRYHRDEQMALLHRSLDAELTQITALVKELGRNAPGGLSFRISRSRHYAETTRALVRTLRVGRIATWLDYETWDHRGTESAFRFIEAVGERLVALHGRLRDVLEAIQTSSIANQTEATRDNTYQLETIARELRDISAGLSRFEEWRAAQRWWGSAAGALTGFLGHVIGAARRMLPGRQGSDG
jgi:hypothetical protein